MSNLKEMIFSTMTHGTETLKEIEITRKNGRDISNDGDKTDEIINKLHPSEIKLKVISVEKENDEIKKYKLATVNGQIVPFEAGQAINLFVNINGVKTSRPYSISSSPYQVGYYELAIAKAKNGFVSNYIFDSVKEGDLLTANGPMGYFVYNPIIDNKRSVFLGGGSGITPFRSMVYEAIESCSDREIYLIYGVRNEKLAVYNEEFKRLAKENKNFHYDLIVSDDKAYKGRKGFITADTIQDIIKTVDNTTFYMCGPRIMTSFCTEELSKLNISPRNIKQEMFGSKDTVMEENGWPSDLKGNEKFKLTVNGKVIEAISGEPILVALERNKIEAKVLCRGGGCGYCRLKLVSGEVFIPGSVKSKARYADVMFGYVHSCKTYPISDVVIEL